MNILVCGTRDVPSQKQADKVMDILHLFTRGETHTLIHGAAPGVDTIASMYAKRVEWEVRPFPADWERHGKAAGPIRNQQMFDENDVDLVLAFPAASSRGTWDMVERAVKNRIPVRVYPL